MKKKHKNDIIILIFVNKQKIGGKGMFIFDLTNPITLLLVVIATALLIFLAQEIKRSSVAIIPLICFLALLIVHVVQVSTLSSEFANLSGTIYKCIAIDFLFILISFFCYLWVDDLEAKKNNIRSIVV